MKTMKKILTAICSFVFVVALGLGFAFSVPATKKASAANAYTGSASVISETPFKLGMNMADWAVNANNAGAIYVSIQGGSAIPYGASQTEDWSVRYKACGNAVKINGETYVAYITKTHADEKAYLNLGEGSTIIANAGDVVTVDGWFENATHGAFCVEEVTFIFDGNNWEEAGTHTYELKTSGTTDTHPQDGFYASIASNDIPVSAENGGWKYNTLPLNAKKNILFNGEAIKAVLQKFTVGDWYINISAGGKTATAGDVVTVGGWFYCTAEGKTTYIKIEPTTFTFDGEKWTQNTSSISVKIDGAEMDGDALYVFPGDTASKITAESTTGDVIVNYEKGALENGAFALRANESKSEYAVTFSVKDANGIVYRRKMTVHVGFTDFVMEEGAAVRSEGDNVNGLRFTAELSKETYENLEAQNAEFGMVIVPKDYITEGYELTANNLFGENAKYSATVAAGKNDVRRMLLLDALTPSDVDGDGRYEIHGSITDILTKNITREFVGVAYVCVDGTYVVASYYGNDINNNARSIYYVAQKAIDAGDKVEKLEEKYINAYGDYVTGLGKTYTRTYTVNYIVSDAGKNSVETETFSAPLNSVVTIEAREIGGFRPNTQKIAQKIYANKDNVFNFYYTSTSAPAYDSVAWYHPNLDSFNGYDNETNNAIAQTMKEAGFTTVNLAGSADPMMNNEANITALKQIIDMFWRNGLKSVVYTHNASTEYYDNQDYIDAGLLPDFSDCEGFVGFLVWDEPKATEEAIEKLIEYAWWFCDTYYDEEESTIRFMVNLLPSYASCFDSKNQDYAASDYKSYAAYIEAYCENIFAVLEEYGATKILSMDSYPIMANGTLRENFLYDLAVLKYYAEAYDAEAHSVLQASGWNEGNTTQAVAPTEDEMRMLLYTALAFGMDSVSWWGYAQPSASGPILADQVAVQYNGTVNENVYNAIKNVNSELAMFGSMYNTFDTWKGVIMSSPSAGSFGGLWGRDSQYNAFNKVKKESLLSSYLLSANSSKSFSSISGSGSNYIIGVMEDEKGNEAFAVVNYAPMNENKTLTLTLNANVAGKYNIYKNGTSTTVEIGNNGYKLTLAPGEGAFIVSASTQHNVTFKNWDGTVLYETTVLYGETPVYSGATPEKAGCDFIGWTPALGAVTTDTVYTAQFNQKWTVTYLNADCEAQIIEGGSVLEEPATPTLDGYVFNGWVTEEGNAYEFGQSIYNNLTLVATWVKLIENGEKSVILTAEQVQAQTVRAQAEHLAIDGVIDNESWYFDTDYPDYGLGGSIEKGTVLAKSVKYSTSSANFTHTLTLPLINYTLYTKVDFAWQSGGAISEMKVNGTEIAVVGNRTISIVTDENGTRAIVYVAMQPVSNNPAITINLSEAVATGKEGLTLSFKSNKDSLPGDGGGYMWMEISQFHGTVRVVDYAAKMAEALAKLPANAEGLTGSAEEAAAVSSYLQYAEYQTAYEKTLPVPEVITAALSRTVTFVDGNGDTTTQTVIMGDKVSAPNAPTFSGYVFKGWMLNGEVYDFNAPVAGDMTLVAGWYKVADNGEKSVILTAEQVKDQVVRAQADYLAVDGVIDNETWYFDTDYPDYGLGGSVEKGTVLAKSVKYTTSSANFTHTLTLPLINYSLYTKVDFAWQSGGAISEMKVNGTEIAVVGNRTISVVTDENGTRAIVYVAMQPVSNNPAITINLSEAVATGKEGLTLSFKSNKDSLPGDGGGYMWMEISQFHGTVRVVDYAAKMAEALAKLPAMVDELTYSAEEIAVAKEYLQYEAYLTAGELKNYQKPAVIRAVGEDRRVQFVNADGTATTEEVYVTVGSTVADLALPTPSLNGYAFKGWMLKGEAYDVNAPIYTNITLVAKWEKLTYEAGEKSVILTAEQVQAQTVMVQDAAYMGCDGVIAGQSWYYDSDYLVNWAGTADQNFKNAVKYGTDAANHTHTLKLPQVNYTLYTKVDFAINSGDQISNIVLGGVEVAYKKNYVVSIRTNENGTYAYVYEMNVGAQNPTPIALSTAVATGKEALTLSFKSNGYMWISVSEFHGTARKTVDYQAKMAEALAKLPANAASLTGSDAEYNAIVEYYTYLGYGTAYEKSLEDPAIIAAAKAQFSGERVIVSGLTSKLTTNKTDPYDAGNNRFGLPYEYGPSFTITLPKVNYSMYSMTKTLFQTSGPNMVSMSAYGTEFTNINSNGWSWLYVMTVADGYKDGYGNTYSAGTYVAIGHANYGPEWLTHVRIPDAVARGEEGLSFTITTEETTKWGWMGFNVGNATYGDKLVAKF